MTRRGRTAARTTPSVRRGQPLGGFHAGHAIGFERIAHVLLDASKMTAKRHEYGIARHTRTFGTQLRQRLGQDGSCVFWGRG